MEGINAASCTGKARSVSPVGGGVPRLKHEWIDLVNGWERVGLWLSSYVVLSSNGGSCMNITVTMGKGCLTSIGD
eukprot:6294329-Amphidinium_carterae.1